MKHLPILTLCYLGFASLVQAVEPGRPAFQVGDPAPEIWGYHAGGEAYNYRKSFRGKTMLLIFWSLEDADHGQLNQRLRQIRRRFLDQPDFVMVSQCVDPHFDTWREYCKRQKNLDGNPFYGDARWIHQTQGGFNPDEVNSAKAFGVTQTPAFFILSPKRKFLAVNVPEKQLAEQIQKVLKQQTER